MDFLESETPGILTHWGLRPQGRLTPLGICTPVRLTCLGKRPQGVMFWQIFLLLRV